MIGARSTVTDDIQYQPLAEFDPDVAAAIAGELGRQRATLEMIASENFVPRSVLQAQGSVFTNKYAEGYPGRRYYGGCENSDIVENLARDRAKASRRRIRQCAAARRRPSQCCRAHGARQPGR